MLAALLVHRQGYVARRERFFRKQSMAAQPAFTPQATILCLCVVAERLYLYPFWRVMHGREAHFAAMGCRSWKQLPV